MRRHPNLQPHRNQRHLNHFVFGIDSRHQFEELTIKTKFEIRYLLTILDLALFMGCGPYIPTSPADLAQCYKAEYGTLPPTGISVIKAQQGGGYGWGEQWLQLQSETNLIDSVFLKKFIKQKTAPPIFRNRTGHTPEWWTIPYSDQFEFYSCDEWTKGSWRTSWASIAVNRNTGRIYFHCRRMD